MTRDSLVLAYISKSWKISISVSKVGRKDYSLAKVCRSIGLGFFPLKDMENIDNEIRSKVRDSDLFMLMSFRTEQVGRLILLRSS